MTIDLSHVVSILLRRKWILLLTCAIALAVAAAASLLITPIYAANTTIRVATAVAGRVEYSDYIYAERLMNTYAEIITTAPVLDAVKAQLELTELPAISVEIIPDTELIRITTEGPNPLVVRDVANALGNMLLAESDTFYSGSERSAQDILGELLTQAEAELTAARIERDGLLRQTPIDEDRVAQLERSIELKEDAFAFLITQFENARMTEMMRASTITLVEPAILPQAPTRPKLFINLLLGGVVGLGGGLGLALLFENVDTVFHSSDALERFVPPQILGQIPAYSRKDPAAKQPIMGANGRFSVAYEAYCRLRTTMLARLRERPYHTLLITSAERHEGKSTIAANLAASLAAIGEEVLLIDADMRLPVQHKIFNLTNKVGLSQVLQSEKSFEEALQPTSIDGLMLLASGPPPKKPDALLGSEALTTLVNQLPDRFDITIFDTPCLLSVTDAAVLSSRVDGVALVASLGLTRRETIRAALRHLADVRADVIGLIINRGRAAHPYYTDAPPRGERKSHALER